MDIRYVENDYNYSTILRSMSLLTKEITHKCYNNDKPFVSLVELAKIVYHYADIFELRKNEVFVKYTPINRSIDYDLYNSPKEIDFLNMLHFDWRGLIENGDAGSTEEVVDVYAVK